MAVTNFIGKNGSRNVIENLQNIAYWLQKNDTFYLNGYEMTDVLYFL